MSLRTKLTVGLGFLFLIIFGMVIYSSFEIQLLSKASDNILKDNYASLVYCRNMFLALDQMSSTISGRMYSQDQNRTDSYNIQLFQTGQAAFESNLNAERKNVTEIHESEYLADLETSYRLFLNLSNQIKEKGGNLALYFGTFLPAASNLRQTISKIDDLNMQAVERKNQSTKHTASQMIISMGIVGTLSILLAFFYFWYFPFYVSNTISYLAKKMKALLQKAEIKADVTTKDESLVLLHSINLLENKFAGAVKESKRRKA
jgi:two-component system, NtrC family, sensor histidine kinase KinB